MNAIPTSSASRPLRIVIAGAGVAGCIMARTLSRIDGVEVICLERVDRADHSESGTGLNIGPNAIKALGAHDPELSEAVRSRSFPWKNWRMSLTDGTVLFDLPMNQVADNDGVRIRWSELYAVLRDAAGDTVRYRSVITAAGISPADPRQCYVEYEADGQAVRIDGIDLLVAGDGRYSAVRSALSGPPPMRQVGVAIYRLLVPDTSGGLIDDYEQWFNGPHRLLAFRVPPGHIYIAGTFPIPAERNIADHEKTIGAIRRYYTPATGKPSTQVKWMIDTLCDNIGAIHWARMQETDPGYLDAAAAALYLGDAAHGMVPTLGQGATQAIEDACAAAELIAARLRDGRRDVREWMESYEALRKERIRFVVDFSYEASDTLFAGADPVAGTRKKLEPPFQDKLKRLFRDVAFTSGESS
jgi:salicylate hydroxylase